MDDLNRILSYVLEEQHNLLELCWEDSESMPLDIHEDDKVTTTIVENSLVMRITRDILRVYIILLNHLAGLLNTQGWEDCQFHLNHHSGKLRLIRLQYRNLI